MLDIGVQVATAGLMYFAVVIAFRVLPNRSSGKLNNYDWVVTVAVGAIIAGTVFDDTVEFYEGLTVIYTLLALVSPLYTETTG